MYYLIFPVILFVLVYFIGLVPTMAFAMIGGLLFAFYVLVIKK